MSKAKISWKTVLLYLTFAVCSLCCGNVFDGALSFGLFVGAVYSVNPFLAAAISVATAIPFGWQRVLHAAIRCGVVIIFVLLHKFIKKKIQKLNLLLYLVASNVFYCVYGTADYFALFDKILYSLCGIAFSFVCIYFFRAVFLRGLAYRPALDEVICISLFMIVASYGMSNLQVLQLRVEYFFFPFVLLFCCSVFGDKVTLVMSALLGLGNLLATGMYDGCVFCVFCAVAVILSFRLNRYVAGLSAIIVDVLMSYFLNLHGSFSTLVFVPTVCSVVVYFAVPTSCYNYLRDCVCGNYEKYLGKTVVKKLGMYTAKKLYRLADILLSMKTAFLTMSVGSVTDEEASKAMVRQCSETVCKDCPEMVRCWRQELANTENNLLQLAQCGVTRGKCTILDVPQHLSLKCVRVSTLLAEINVQCKTYRDYADRTEQVNGGKVLLGEQLGGVSQLLTQLAGDCKGKVSYSGEKEKELVERLVFHNVLCSGAVVMEQSGSLSVIATVAKKDVDKEVIEKVASNLFGQNMTVDRTDTTESPSWVNVSLSVKPRFEVSFGVSSVPKEGSEASGDTHSVMKTDNGKCIVALCDGMGSGSNAEKMSETAIGLVENFYRAGFDSDTILSCVNHMLVGCGNEVFCAVDICVADLTNGLADFIKLGAPCGIVKNNGNVEIIAGSSLPLGVLEEMRPSVTKKALAEGDMVVLVSDGVADCFDDANALAQVVADTSCTNPQSVAEIVLNKALRNCGKAKDDMTVLVIKLS